MSETPGRRRHRRVQRPGAPGTDPEPRAEPRDEPAPPAAPDSDNAPAWSSNDERLRRDVPPHW
ncbi:MULTISPECIES: hypothetical protein [Leifsonia]|uniref:Uncharacterized protein n=1 Tax=Leifsonia soli TaxID=582665 RepID=A0A852SZS5_9MICO|nr:MULTISPECIES: hypothetical protein [Leifsonia]NYD74153.1 hypothetical protein [Leifsonia soli]